MPKISIIIPVYNVENYLERCLISVLNQNLTDIEIILVDDGSTDSSRDICKIYEKKDPRIKLICKENGGQSSARNEGIKYATADLIGFVDSDDWISSDMYEYLFNLQQKTDADIVSCNYILVNNYTTTIKNVDEQIFLFNKDRALINYLEMGIFNRKNDYSVWQKLYKKTLFNSIKFENGLIYEDILINFSLIKACNKYVYSKKICYFYFQDNISTTRNQYSLRHNDLFTIINKMRVYAKGENEYIRKLIDILEIKSYFSLLTKSARFGNVDKISDSYVKENLLLPFKKCYKQFMREKFSFIFKILGTAYYLNWDLSKKIIGFLKK